MELQPDLYDIHRCCVYSEKLLMMDRGTVPKHVEFHSKNKFEKLVHLVGFIFILKKFLILQITLRTNAERDLKTIHPGTLLINRKILYRLSSL